MPAKKCGFRPAFTAIAGYSKDEHLLYNEGPVPAEGAGLRPPRGRSKRIIFDQKRPEAQGRLGCGECPARTKETSSLLEGLEPCTLTQTSLRTAKGVAVSRYN